MVYLLYLTVIFYTTKLERLDGNGLTFRFRFNVVAVDRREMRTIVRFLRVYPSVYIGLSIYCMCKDLLSSPQFQYGNGVA